MPTIRIDDEVYELLKRNAEPLVDTPNSVFRRLVGLDDRSEPEAVDGRGSDSSTRRASAEHEAVQPTPRRTSRRRRGLRVSKGDHLPASRYELPILEVLVDNGGRAPTYKVIDEVGARLDEEFTGLEPQRLPSGEVRWRNTTMWARKTLVTTGDLADDSPRGIWEITDQGRRRVREATS